MKRMTTKGPQRTLGRKYKKETFHLKDHLQLKTKLKPDRKRKQVDHLKKIKPSTFDGESRTREEAEAWLLDIKKYFQIYNYSSNMKVRMSIYNLKGKANIWW